MYILYTHTHTHTHTQPEHSTEAVTHQLLVRRHLQLPLELLYLTLMLSMLMVVVLDNFKKSDAHCYIMERPGFQAD